MRRLLLTISGFLMGFSFALRAQEQPVAVELLTDATDCSRPFTVGLHFSVQPNWYLYWKNPGDAGLPIAVKWSLPPGFSAGDLQHPTPEKIVHGDIVAYGYYQEVLLIATMFPPSNYRPQGTDAIAAKLDWLVCSESCIPGGASVSMNVADVSSAQRKRASELFATYKALMPAPLESIGITVRQGVSTKREDGHRVRIMLEGNDRHRVSDFYPEPLEEVVLNFHGIHVTDSTITIPYVPGTASATVNEVRGLAIVDGKGYTLKSSVHQP